jgi:hypothetical protein
MSLKSTRGWMRDRRSGRLVAAAATLAAFASLAALPTASAGAAAPSISPVPPVQIEEALAETPLSAVNLSQLVEALGKLQGLSGLEPAVIEAALTETIETLREENATVGELLEPAETAPILEARLKEALGPLAGLLATLLGGNPTTKLEEALESSDPRTLLGELLGKSPEPEKLIEEILSALDPEELESLLGGLPTGEPFSTRTVEELASQLGTTANGLAEQLGAEANELPGEAMALTGPLTNGKTLAVLNGVKGLAVGTIEEPAEALEGGGGSGSGGSGSGGSGGPGGGGAPGGNGGSTTVIVPGSQPPSATSAAAGAVGGAIKVLSHKVKGKQATIIVQVPSAGTLSLSGKGVRSAHQEAARAERKTLQIVLTRAAGASLKRLHRSHRRLTVPVKVSFKPVTGSSSSAGVSLAFG